MYKTEQKTSLIERLKICWYVLTMRNYIYFGASRNPFIDNGDGLHCNKGKVRSYSYIADDGRLIGDDGEMSLHDFIWGVVEDFARLARGIKTDNKNK